PPPSWNSTTPGRTASPPVSSAASQPTIVAPSISYSIFVLVTIEPNLTQPGRTVVGVPTSERFDAAYYSRFYGRRPVHDLRRIAHLAGGVMELAAWWRVPIRSMLDVGAGKGYWRDWLATAHPRVAYHGIDVSEHACRRYGHEQADLVTWRPAHRYD